MVPKVAACVHALRGGVRARPHPQRHGAARAAARGLHRRGRRHDDHRPPAEEAVGDDASASTRAGRPRRDVRSCRRTRASRCCSCAARACASTTTTAGSTSTSSAASARSTSATRIRRSRRRCAEQAAKLVHVSNLFYVEHRAELAARRRRASRRRMEDVLRQLRRRGDRGRDQARAPLGGRAQARRVQGRDARAQLPRPHARRARGDRAGLASRRRSRRCPRASSTCPPTTSRRSRRPSTRRVAAVMLEVVQGEGGVWPLTAEYLAAARRICDERDVPADRSTRSRPASSAPAPRSRTRRSASTPDVVTVAKALANGLPIGGFLARGDVAEALQPGDHGSTFGGGPRRVRRGPRDDRRARRRATSARTRVESGAYLRDRPDRAWPKRPARSPMSAAPASWSA